RGEPLTDADRMPWLRAIEGWMDERIATGEPAVIACSALKLGYREMLLTGRPEARIAFLQIDHDVAARRLATRHGHFFDPDLLDSQFADLELPRQGEAGVVVVPVRDSAEQTTADIIRNLDINRQPGGV
ncbi:MAG: hypothetical protein LBV34_07985, partial [Nocardiopsaceae bacterium]|nr:hypothetical protein [Nocardiopsaceae bacterium]